MTVNFPRPLQHVARVSLAACLIVLAGCAADKPKPKPLEPITAPLAVSQVWSQHISSVSFPLQVAILKDQFVLGGDDGSVVALEAATGRELWRASAGAKLSAGVGSDGRFAAVVTRDNDLVVFDQGQVKWRKPLGARVSTAPLVAGERVFVLGVDRAVQAFDAINGRKLWAMPRQGDPLTLAQTNVLSAFKDTLVVGQGARMVGVDPLLGNVRWDVAVGSPRGANEIERLADLVGPAVRTGDLVCARSFQAAVGCVDAERGTLVWNKVVGGTEGVSGDAELVVAADASDRLTAWKTPTGNVAWTSDRLQYRGLGAPLLTSQSVIFGDADGTVHFLSRDNGSALQRLPTDGGAILMAPVVSGRTLLVVTRKGGLFAFRR